MLSSDANAGNKNKLKEMMTKHRNILGDNIGFIRFLEVMGSDRSIVNAARISANRGETLVELPDDFEPDRDRRLIRFLMKYKHTSPFEMCELKIHVKAPMFVVRQWVRHRTANLNEYSARYAQMLHEFYYPTQDMIRTQSELNKQMSSDYGFDDEKYNEIIAKMKESCEKSWSVYEDMLSYGVARETARGILPVNIYTEFYWKLDAHNLMHFFNLRCRPEAQQEIRMYALVMMDFFKVWLPMTYEAFMDYIFQGHNFSKDELKVLLQCVDRDKFAELIDQNNNMTKREKNNIKTLIDNKKH